MNARKSKKSVKKKSKIKFIISFILFQIVFTGITAPFLAYYGPFENVRNTLVTTAMTTLSHQWIAELFLSKETINKILKEQAVTNLSQKKDAETEVIVSNKNDKTIERFEVNSNKFTGYVLIINDSTRVKVGYSEKLEIEGQTTSEIAENNGAIAAINGGGFTDEATGSLWTGTGAKPTGIIMNNGEVKYNDLSSDDEQREVVAITEAGVLLVGSYSLNELIQHKAKEAVSFGPALIVDGQKAITNGDGGWGIAPRTAIGQRKDGAIILLVIDGRQTNSIGATLKEAQDVLYEYGAYNASNLDGGSSSTMYYKGEVINSPSDSLGERAVPSAIYVEK
ncbi:phosphodiester glycosidase family protein [Clostridium sp. Marseille-Q7071]